MVASQKESTAPLLYFDTGIGGLSVLREGQNLLPTAPVIYAADYAGIPYGMKTEAELAARVPALLGRLVERYKPQLAIIACNTASTITLDFVRSALDVPVVGTVPAVKPASEITKTGVIGLLGTKATIRQPYVDRLAAEFAADKTILRHAAPDLVYAAEAKLRGEEPDRDIIQAAIEGLTSQANSEDIDVIILACTHFPLVEAELREAIDRPVKFVDGAKGIARRIAFLTSDIVWPERASNGTFVTTGEIETLDAYKPQLTDHGITRFETL